MKINEMCKTVLRRNLWKSLLSNDSINFVEIWNKSTFLFDLTKDYNER